MDTKAKVGTAAGAIALVVGGIYSVVQLSKGPDYSWVTVRSNTIVRPTGFLFDAGPIWYPTERYQYMSCRPGFTNKIPIFTLKQRPNGEQWLNFLTFEVPLGARQLLIEALHHEPYLAWIPLLEYEYKDSDPRNIGVDVNWIPTNRPTFRILYSKQ